MCDVMIGDDEMGERGPGCAPFLTISPPPSSFFLSFFFSFAPLRGNPATSFHQVVDAFVCSATLNALLGPFRPIPAPRSPSNDSPSKDSAPDDSSAPPGTASWGVRASGVIGRRGEGGSSAALAPLIQHLIPAPPRAPPMTPTLPVTPPAAEVRRGGAAAFASHVATPEGAVGELVMQPLFVFQLSSSEK